MNPQENFSNQSENFNAQDQTTSDNNLSRQVIHSEQHLQIAENNLNHMNTSLQKQPDKVGTRQTELEARLKKLGEMNTNVFKRLVISKGDRALLQLDEAANREALSIIRAGENNNISAIADYQTRYLKSILHNLVLMSEGTIQGAAKLHYDNAKMFLHSKLLVKLDEMTFILQDYEKRAMGRPEKYRQVLIMAADRTLEQWYKDFERYLQEFAELLNKTFSR
jgi:hypothetical protein